MKYSIYKSIQVNELGYMTYEITFCIFTQTKTFKFGELDDYMTFYLSYNDDVEQARTLKEELA